MLGFLMAEGWYWGAASGGWLQLDFWISAAKAILGLGGVIFVHELGHFLVAKACGVKCEKFYLGFDIYGLKLARFQWGETEYGIGILPLGGYVKMLGQDDNPNQMAEEFQRAQTAEGLDPRSYLAQSIPERMAIISAGVVMNLIFAVIFASIAYGLGVDYTPCIVGSVTPGDPAWVADLRPGDELVTVNGVSKARFEHDLMYGSMLADREQGLPLEVRRRDSDAILTTRLVPKWREELGRMVIGMASAQSLTIRLPENAEHFVGGFARATPPLKSGDQITAVDGTPVESFAEFEALALARASQPLTLTIRRAPPKDQPKAPVETLSIVVPPQPFKMLGLVMEMGPIIGVQLHSPAERIGLQIGDQLVSIDGLPVGDPLTLGERLRSRAGEKVTLVVERGSKREPVSLPVELRAADWVELPKSSRAPMSAPALGIAYGVGTKIVAIEPDSPAARAGVVAGGTVTAAKLVFPPEVAKALEMPRSEIEYELVGEGRRRVDWPAFALSEIQQPVASFEVRLTTEDGASFTLHPIDASDFFAADHGLYFDPARRKRVAESFGEAVSLGSRETYENALLVYSLLRRMGSGQVSATNLGGPGTILAAAGRSASQGLAPLLIFLTMLSANLAVINFLPIPLLDGGHMVMLAYEAIWRKPVSEQVLIGLQYLGAAILMSLMLWVLGLDVFRFLISPFL